MNKRSMARLAVLILVLATAFGGFGLEGLEAQEVTVAAILGSDHNLGDRQLGDPVDPTEVIRAGSGTIVVLEGIWRRTNGSCLDWLIISGRSARFGTTEPTACESDRTGSEILAAARDAGGLAEHALALALAKADVPEWVPPFQQQLTHLSEPATQYIVSGSYPTALSGTYTIRQASNGRYVDAHEDSGNDFGLVTRSAQDNDTQRWILTPLGNNRYTIQQASNARFVDAHEDSGNDFRLVTRSAQNNDTQRWILTSLGNDHYTIQQASNGRYVDAHQDASNDFRLVTRMAQNNYTQRWIITRV